jgi:hypothetical protein
LSALETERTAASQGHVQELAAAREEVNALIVANEMAESACALLRRELAERQADGAIRSQRAADLEVILASTSWRVTAPLRAFTRAFRRSRN